MGRSLSHQRKLAGTLALSVLALQASVIISFILDPSDPPRQGTLWQGLWAMCHKAGFIPLVGLLVVGPPATWLACSTRGSHRRWLSAGWGGFILVASIWFAHRIWVMTRLVWEHGW
jgi:hypothetical protein